LKGKDNLFAPGKLEFLKEKAIYGPEMLFLRENELWVISKWYMCEKLSCFCSLCPIWICEVVFLVENVWNFKRTGRAGRKFLTGGGRSCVSGQAGVSGRKCHLSGDRNVFRIE